MAKKDPDSHLEFCLSYYLLDLGALIFVQISLETKTELQHFYIVPQMYPNAFVNLLCVNAPLVQMWQNIPWCSYFLLPYIYLVYRTYE